MYMAAHPCSLKEDCRDEDTVKSDYQYEVSRMITNLEDHGGHIYAVGDGKSCRVLGGYVTKGTGDYYHVAGSVRECILPVIEMKKLVERLTDFYQKEIVSLCFWREKWRRLRLASVEEGKSV
jgi:hypothetical protein